MDSRGNNSCLIVGVLNILNLSGWLMLGDHKMLLSRPTLIEDQPNLSYDHDILCQYVYPQW